MSNYGVLYVILWRHCNGVLYDVGKYGINSNARVCGFWYTNIIHNGMRYKGFPLWGNSTGYQWSLLTIGQWCVALIFSVMLAKTVEQTTELLVIWDAMSPKWRPYDRHAETHENNIVNTIFGSMISDLIWNKYWNWCRCIQRKDSDGLSSQQVGLII